MTPEEEWLQTMFKREREARAFCDMLEPNERVRVWSMHGKTNSFSWVLKTVVVFLVLIAVGMYFS